MPNFREYNARLTQLLNMRRVTLAMKMLSTTKLARAQLAQARAVEFARDWDRLVHVAAQAAGPSRDPLLAPRPQREAAFLLLVTSDMGLCAGFNNNLVHKVHAWLDENRGRYKFLRFSFCGRKGYNFFREKVEVRTYYEGVTRRPDFGQALRIGREVFTAFAEHKYDEVFIAYNRFHSAMTQEPVIEQVLPLAPLPADADARPAPFTLMEPAPEQLLPALLEQQVYLRVFAALLANAAGEHGARMTAMDNATKNIDKLCDTYTLLRNRARQNAVTTELIEVVSGAEALQ